MFFVGVLMYMALFNSKDLLDNPAQKFSEKKFLIDNPFTEIIPKQPDDFDTINSV